MNLQSELMIIPLHRWIELGLVSGIDEKRCAPPEEKRRRFAKKNCVECGIEFKSRRKRCAECASAHEQARLDRNHQLKRYRRHGITEEFYVVLLEFQGGVCANCRTDTPDSSNRSWSIDHDHGCCPTQYSCGNCVRGLLCTACNSGIGQFQDDPIRMVNGAFYLIDPPASRLRRLLGDEAA